jgi:hypothetical protein
MLKVSVTGDNAHRMAYLQAMIVLVKVTHILISAHISSITQLHISALLLNYKSQLLWPSTMVMVVSRQIKK